MGNLRLALQVFPAERRRERRSPCDERVGVVVDGDRTPVIEAEVMDISPHGCRIRVRKGLIDFKPQQVCIQFAWTEMTGRVVWTNTTEEFMEMGISVSRAAGLR